VSTQGVRFGSAFLRARWPRGTGLRGQPWGRGDGLYYYRARYYDPALGRFISRDPAEWGDGTTNWGAGDINWTTKDPTRFHGGLDLYAYVDNNPCQQDRPHW